MNMSATATRIISIAREFTETPGPRYIKEGDFSGELFLNKILRSAYQDAKAEGATLRIDFDGTEGYATSFLESAFGGLAREFQASEILTIVSFKSDDEPYLIKEVTKYIEEARKK
jgi:hypothetical protein